MNYVGPLLISTFMSVTYHYVLVFIDRLTKMRHLVLTAIMKVDEVTQAFYTYVWKLHELPEFFVSDCDIQFTSEVWSHLCQMLRIDAKYFTAYHLKTDEQTERPNAIIKHYLQVFINYMQDDWTKWISGAEFVTNNVPSVITLASLFLANSDQNPHLRFKSPEPLATDLTVQQQIKLLDIENFTKKMKDLTEHLRVEMLIAQAMYEFSVNKSHCPCPHYFIEDEVWLNVKNLNITHSAVKLNNHHVRSFKVKCVFEKNPLVTGDKDIGIGTMQWRLDTLGRHWIDR